MSVIDNGLQVQTDWETQKTTDKDGNEIPPKRTVTFTFETPDETIDVKDGDDTVTKPRWIQKEYPLTRHEKSGLTKIINALNPDVKTLDEFLNVPCMITIGSTKNDKAKVTGISKPMKGMEVPELFGESFHFDFDNPNMELFNGLLKWQQDKIKEALNYTGFADGDVPMDSTGTNDF